MTSAEESGKISLDDVIEYMKESDGSTQPFVCWFVGFFSVAVHARSTSWVNLVGQAHAQGGQNVERHYVQCTS